MSQPYVGEIRMFAGNFAPAGWAFCDGQLIPISENDALFTLLGTRYGGDGQETFALPDLRSRVPIHFGQGSGLSNYILGENGGVESVTLTTQQTPTHNHAVLTTGAASAITPGGNVLAPVSAPPAVVNPLLYGSDAPLVALNAATVVPVGGSQPHENTQPTLGLNFIISLFGFFPSPT